jgi:DNA-binding MarR family transcriptional regulator
MTNEAATTDPALLERLDRLTQILELSLAPQLDTARAELRADEVDAAIFDCTAGGWKAAADLQREVGKATKTKTRAIQEHLSRLIERGLIQKRGSIRDAEYRSSGLI